MTASNSGNESFMERIERLRERGMERKQELKNLFGENDE